MKKEKQFILHNTVIHVALVVVWIVESFCLNKKDCPPFVFESFVLLSMYCIQNCIHGEEGQFVPIFESNGTSFCVGILF